jgi:hypothetical protein
VDSRKLYVNNQKHISILLETENQKEGEEKIHPILTLSASVNNSKVSYQDVQEEQKKMMI